MTQKKETNQLGKLPYFNSIAIFLVLVVVFLFFANLDFFWEQMNQKREMERIPFYEALNEIENNRLENSKTENDKIENNKTISQEHHNIYFWGDTNLDVIVKHQLDNMKEEYVVVQTLSECAGAELIFANKREYSPDEITCLQQLSRKGAVICLAGLPKKENLNAAYVKDFLGIDECKTEQKKKGYRLAESLLFGNIDERIESFTTMDLSLGQRTEVYVSALEDTTETEKEAEVKNHELTPLFWRYKANPEQSSIYVINDVLLQEEVGYAVISFIMSDVYGTYMYPVINAYCLAIQGMPYSLNYESEFLVKQYGKDALGIENDIIFPQINRCEERYNMFITWYSKEYDTIMDTDNTLLKYYIEDIKRSEGTIGFYNETGLGIEMPYENRLKIWTADFAWKNGNIVQIPYDRMSDDAYQTTIMDDMCEIRGCGFHCVSVDVEEFLSENSSFEWVSFIDGLETLLGIEKQDFYWIDRMTVEDAVYRIKSYEIMEPVFTYEEDKVTVNILNFTGEAYFYLHTDKSVTDVIGGEFLEISKNMYFISAANEDLEVLLAEKRFMGNGGAK